MEIPNQKKTFWRKCIILVVYIPESIENDGEKHHDSYKIESLYYSSWYVINKIRLYLGYTSRILDQVKSYLPYSVITYQLVICCLVIFTTFSSKSNPPHEEKVV
jgi:hypothetical protein